MKIALARGVTKRFGSFAAVDDVDLDVDAGEIVGLLGANGAGKTTLIRMLLGLLLPTAGSVRLFDEPASLGQRRRIGYVPQNLGLYTDLTARENLEFRASVFGVEPALGHADEVLVSALSLGRQRVVAFDGATQHDPGLLVLDEPTSGVSPLTRSRLWDLIHDRAERGAGVLVSTHYMDEAEQADRLVVMSNGRVVATGTVPEVIGDRSAVAVRTDRWADAFAVLDHPGRRLRLAGRTIRVIGERPADISDLLVRAGVAATTVSVPATLEEVLIEIDARDPAEPDAKGQRTPGGADTVGTAT